MRQGYRIKPHGQLVPVSSTRLLAFHIRPINVVVSATLQGDHLYAQRLINRCDKPPAAPDAHQGGLREVSS